MALSQDQAQIVVQILNTLKYTPTDGKTVSGIIDELNKVIVDKTTTIPLVTVLPENMNITIEKKAK